MREFKYFIKKGIVKKISVDKARAEFLIKEAEQDYTYLVELMGKIPLRDNNANNYIKNCYDILMGLIRAKMLLGGFSASGLGAHEAEVSYLRMLKFNEKDVQFVNQIRFFRNGMLYYGTILDREYAEKVIHFTRSIYKKLKNILNLD